jgi:hypothetical protein
MRNTRQAVAMLWPLTGQAGVIAVPDPDRAVQPIPVLLTGALTVRIWLGVFGTRKTVAGVWSGTLVADWVAWTIEHITGFATVPVVTDRIHALIEMCGWDSVVAVACGWAVAGGTAWVADAREPRAVVFGV